MAFINTPRINGDGHEYVYMTESFIQHGTPDLQQSDFDISNTKLKTKTGFLYVPKTYPYFHFYTGTDGYYSWHFWLYPMFVAPVQQFVHVFHGDELRAFSITNALLYIAMLWVIFCFAPQKHKFLLLGLMAFSPLLPYISWTHTEIFSATLVTMALVFWLRKNFKPAILLSALASCQNPPVIVFTIWAVFAYLWDCYKKYCENKQIDIRDTVITGLCGLPALLSPLFYYTKFSTLNLIQHVGASDFGFISFHRFLSYFFDLNQGAIVYSGILLFMFMYYAIKNLIHKNFKNFELVIFVIFFALLSCTTVTWVLGMNIVTRYFVWTYPLLVFYIVYNIDTEKNVRLGYFLIATMFLLCCINNWFRGYGDLPNHNLLSRSILSHLPTIYNPEPEIFIYRTYKISPGKINTDTYPVIYVDNKGRATKILTDKQGWEKIKHDEYCTINDMEFYDKQLYNFVDNNPKYINVYGNKLSRCLIQLNIDKKLMFSEIDTYIPGLSAKDSSLGRWSDSNTVKFRLKFLSINTKSESVILKINGHPFVNERHKNLKMRIYLNGKYMQTWSFGYNLTRPEQIISIPVADILQNNLKSELRFEIENPMAPGDLKQSADHRKLGFSFESIEIIKDNKPRKQK